MCGRFTQNYTWADVHRFLSVFGPPRNLKPRYNIAPTTTIDVIRLNADGQRELMPMLPSLTPRQKGIEVGLGLPPQKTLTGRLIFVMA